MGLISLPPGHFLWLKLTFLRIAITIALATTTAHPPQLSYPLTHTHNRSSSKLCARAIPGTYEQFLRLWRGVFLPSIRFSNSLQLAFHIRLPQLASNIRLSNVAPNIQLVPNDSLRFQSLLLLPDREHVFSRLSCSMPHVLHLHVVLSQLLLPNYHTHLIHDLVPARAVIHTLGISRRGR